jgi:hypothetical protein
MFCDAYRLSRRSKTGAIGLFFVNCGLLIGGYILTHGFSNLTQDLLFKIIGEQIPRQFVTFAAGGLAQLVVTNSAFFVVRFVLAKIIYAIYELGRGIVFSILVLILAAGGLWLAGQYYLDWNAPSEFVQSHRILVFSVLISWTITTWYWGRYIYRGSTRQHVFDYEVGAALVQLSK